jgi:hypothetical protein
MLMNSLINLMILFMCKKIPSYMIQLVTLLNFLLVCNYYERGGDKYTLYVSSNDMLCSPTNEMQWYTSSCCYLVLYKIPMHRKKVRLRYYYFHILWCSLPCFSLTIILIITPWDLGIMYGALSKKKVKVHKYKFPHDTFPS